MTLKLSRSTLTQWMGNSLLFLFLTVVLLDPTNTVLHMKDKVFALLLGFCILVYKPDWHYLPHLLIIALSMLMGYLLAELQGNTIDDKVLSSTFKSIAPLILLLYVRNFDFIKINIVPSLITTFSLVLLFSLAVSNPIFERAIWYYVREHGDVIMMSRRSFLGFKFFGMYGKTLVAMTFSLYLVYYKALNAPSKRRLYYFLGFFLSFAFIVSGSRSTMLLPFALLGIAAFYRIIKTRASKYILLPLISLLGLFFLFFILLLASETSEASNLIKYAHLFSYKELFEAHPEYLLIGQGPATSFYSAGFGRMTSITEWTYLELLRNYGLFSIPIMSIFLLPLVRLFRYRHNHLTQGIIFSYIIYLLIAGTNPLLLSSTGMVVILSAYSYCEQVQQKVSAIHEESTGIDVHL